MRRLLLSLLAGLVFGFGLALSGMTLPGKVLDFLDVSGHWDPSLAFVMGGALAVTLPTFTRVLRSSGPLWDKTFAVSPLTRIDAGLVLGSLAFGVGWGACGYCPGPAVALLASPNGEALVLLPSLLAGTVLARMFQRPGRAEDPAQGKGPPQPGADPIPGCG